jgi:hypothetical protein
MQFAVRTTDRRFLDVLRRYLERFRVESGSDDIVFSADCGIERTVGGRAHVSGLKRLFFGGLLLFRGRTMEEMAARLVSGFRDWTNNQSNEFFRIRAGSVVIDGGAMLLPSLPSTELSAFVGTLVRSGLAGYVGDEITNVDPILRRANGIGLPLLIDGEQMWRFPEIEATPTRPGRRHGQPLPVQARPRWPVRLEDLGGTFSPPTDIRWIVMPAFRPDQPTRVESLPKAEALFGFAEAALNLHIWADRALVLMRELIADHLVGRLVIGDFDEGARVLVDLASGGAGGR